MKTNSRLNLAILPCLLFLSISFNAQSQTLARQSIGTIGGSTQVSGIFVQAAVGQTYSTTPYMHIRPGFIQPLHAAAAPSSAELNIKVYPNPTSDLVIIESPEQLQEGRIEVRDIYGKLVYEQAYKQEFTQEVNCSSWAVGTYFITVTDRNSKAHSSKLIKSN